MKMRTLLVFAACLLLVLPAAAQDRKQARKDPSTSAATEEKCSTRAVNLIGIIGVSGTSFLAEAEGRVWKGLNSEALERMEGLRVRVDARITSAEDSIFITSVKRTDGTRGTIKLDDAAFRR
jgi:hypothetical protein